MNRLFKYLEENGILLCNVNPYLPALDNVGCTWSDVTELIDAHELFYSKVFKKRTTYLSVEAYYLLKEVRKRKNLTEPAKQIYASIKNNPPLETKELKMISMLSAKEYAAGFDELLQNMYITALQNGKKINPTWSTFYYGTSEARERHHMDHYDKRNAEERLWELFGKNMKEKDFKSMLGK